LTTVRFYALIQSSGGLEPPLQYILADHQVAAELKLRHGLPVDEIIREAQIGDYDLVVIGASGVSNGLKGWFLGNVTQQIVDQVVRPVLVVRRQSVASKVNM